MNEARENHLIEDYKRGRAVLEAELAVMQAKVYSLNDKLINCERHEKRCAELDLFVEELLVERDAARKAKTCIDCETNKAVADGLKETIRRQEREIAQLVERFRILVDENKTLANAAKAAKRKVSVLASKPVARQTIAVTSVEDYLL